MPLSKSEPEWSSICASGTQEPSVRLLCFKGNDRDTRKLIYDSDTVRPVISPDGQVHYQYLPKKADVKFFWSRMIGDGAALMKNTINKSKVHPFDDGVTQMWSSVFSMSGSHHHPNSASSSFNSSFGSNLSIASNENAPLKETPHGVWQEDVPQRGASGNIGHDSGIFSLSSAGKSSIQLSSQSFTGYDPDLSRRLSHIQFESSVPQRGDSHQHGLTIKVTPDSCEGIKINEAKPSSPLHLGLPLECSSGRNRRSSQTSSNTILAFGLVVCSRELILLREDSLFMEDLMNKCQLLTTEAYCSRKDFPKLMHHAWLEMERQVRAFFSVSRLRYGVYHELIMCLENDEHDRHTAAAKLWLTTAKSLLSQMDTKENTFFLSTLLSAFLRYHLGWVLSVVPSTQEESEKEAPTKIGEHHRVAYDKHKLKLSDLEYGSSWLQTQHAQLHGMLGFPINSCKTVIVGSDSDRLQKVLYFLSFFLRSSLSVKNRLQILDSTQDILAFDLNQELVAVETQKEGSETSSSGQLVFASKESASLPMKKSSRAALLTLEAMPRSSIDEAAESLKDCVTFQIGENESLVHPENMSTFFTKRESKAGKSLIESERTSGSRSAGDKGTSQPVAGARIAAEEQHIKSSLLDKKCFYQDIPLSISLNKSPGQEFEDLPRFICVADDRPILGAVLQGCVMKEKSAKERQNILIESLYYDLLSESESNYCREASERFCLVADVDFNTVQVFSSSEIKQRSAGRSFPLTPVITELVDGIRAVQDCHPILAISSIDDFLKDILLSSKLLADYFMAVDCATARKIKDDLGFDLCDLNLLLPVASTHTPEVGRRYVLSSPGEQRL